MLDICRATLKKNKEFLCREKRKGKRRGVSLWGGGREKAREKERDQEIKEGNVENGGLIERGRGTEKRIGKERERDGE